MVVSTFGVVEGSDTFELGIGVFIMEYFVSVFPNIVGVVKKCSISSSAVAHRCPSSVVTGCS
jgi:hypothetical protein